VSEAEAVLLGVLAGLTVLLGMPLARRLRSGQVLLNSLSCGVLVYLLGDMLARAFVPLNSALLRQYDNLDGAEPVVWLTVAFIGGLVLGYGGLTAYVALSGVSDAAETTARGTPPEPSPTASSSRLALLVAIGIGLHNLGGGLALGNLAGNDWISISVVLVVGYLLQNLVVAGAITAPFAGDPQPPKWSCLLLLGVIAGGPTVLGTYLGWRLVDVASGETGDLTSTAVQALAAGAILFVLIRLLSLATTLGHRTTRHLGLLAGLVIALLIEVLIIGATGA
jgi:ZIP family zinc transporter